MSDDFCESVFVPLPGFCQKRAGECVMLISTEKVGMGASLHRLRW